MGTNNTYVNPATYGELMKNYHQVREVDAFYLNIYDY